MSKRVKTVLFLCTGNYFRSRFAEILFVAVARKMGLPWNATSRALALERGVNNVGPIATTAINALQAMKICDEARCTRFPIQVTAGDLAAADAIIALKRAEHLPLLEERFPDWAKKVECWDVDDAPEVLALIEREIAALAARLLANGSCPR